MFIGCARSAFSSQPSHNPSSDTMQGPPLTLPLLPTYPSSHSYSREHILTPTISLHKRPTPYYTPCDNASSTSTPCLFPYLSKPPVDPFVTPPVTYATEPTPMNPYRSLTMSRLDLNSPPHPTWTSPPPIYPLANPFVEYRPSILSFFDIPPPPPVKPRYLPKRPPDLDMNNKNISAADIQMIRNTPCPREPFGPLFSLFTQPPQQTRRTTRRADENAAPSARLRSTAAAAPAPSGKAANTASNIPVLKRAHSAVTATAPAPAASKPVAAGTKRSALGEVTNGGKDNVAKGGKGKDEGAKEKRALQQTSSAQIPASAAVAGPARRTRSSTGAAPVVAPVVEPAPKRRTTSRIPVAARSRSTTASTSTTVADGRLKERKLNIAIETKEVVEPEPARKKRKTSSPAPEEDTEEDDLADEELYDEDGREVVLNSGGRATRLRSPERGTRAKDAGWTDLDAEDDGDPTMVSEYVVDAFNYMLAIESKSMPDPEYMDRQAELTWEMRALLMDWLIEVHSKFRLLPETLLIAVNMIDRFLSQRVVSLEKLQLVGMTALFISAKYEEVICPSITHFLHMADGGFAVDDMIKAERYMLSTLDFDMSYPNPLHFLRRISKADGYDIQTRTLAKFLIEVMCVEKQLIVYKPSLLAAAGTWLARLCLDRGRWTPNLVHYSTYAVSELLEPAQIMVDYILSPTLNTDGGFYKKYACKKHMKSSVYIRQWALNRWPESADGTSEFQGEELVAEIEGRLEPVMEVRDY